MQLKINTHINSLHIMEIKHITNSFKKNSLIIIFFLSYNAFTQQKDTISSFEKITSRIHLSGSIDGYYRYNFNNSNTNSIAPKTSFVNQSGFALGMANGVYDKFPFLLKFSIFIRNIFNGYKDSSLVNLRQTF